MLLQPRDLAPLLVLARLGVALLMLGGVVTSAAAGAAWLHHHHQSMSA